MKTWKNVVKDILMIIFSATFFLLSPAVTSMQNEQWVVGIVLIATALVLWIPIYFVAYHWHKRNIHATIFGNVASMGVFIISPFVAWYYDFSLWPLLLILVYLIFGFLKKRGRSTNLS